MYQLTRLPYQYQDIEPFIDTHTIGLHYHKHQQNYLNKLNELLLKNNYDYRYSIEELPYYINEFSISTREDILFNLGGVLNHNLYWKSINANKKEKPQGLLKQYIEKFFGSYENFWNMLKEKAMSLKGSGYTFLVITPSKTLELINEVNQDMPQTKGFVPIFNVDLWEHAYYLNYENDKAKYLDNIKQIADFSYANKLLNHMAK